MGRQLERLANEKKSNFDIARLTFEIPIKFSPTQFVWMVEPAAIAEQLTLIQMKIFKSVQLGELLGQSWSKEATKARSPNVLQLIGRFNTVSRWVASMVLIEDRVQT